MFNSTLERKEAVSQILNELLAEEAPAINEFNYEWMLDLQVRDAVIWHIYDTTNNNEDYPKSIWISTVADRLSSMANLMDNEKCKSMYYAIAGALTWNKQFIETAKAYSTSNFLRLIDRAITAQVPKQIFVDSVTCLTLNEIYKEEDNETEKTNTKLALCSPDEVAKHLFTHEYFQHSETGFIILTPGSHEVVGTTESDIADLNNILDSYSLNGFENKVVCFTFDETLTRYSFNDLPFILDLLYINREKGTYRSLMCDDYKCCPEEGKAIIA